MIKQFKIFFLLFLLLPFILFPQEKNLNIFETRIDKYLRLNNHLNLVTATDHLPLFINNPLDHWTASKTQLLIDGIAFDQFPLNLNSPDFLPINFPNVSQIKQEMFPGIKPFSAAPLGYIDVHQNSDLPDSLLFKFRSYIGSETGDPLIHIFTRENLEQGNRNKIPFSGSLSFTDKISETNYWFSIGNYGSYSTGSVNDGIIFNKSNYFSQKQNKQIFGSAGFQTKRDKKEYSLSATIISYYGWDIPPFIASYIHFETYLYTIRASVKNLTGGLSLFLVSDGSITEINGGKGIPASKFNLSKYSLLSKYENKIGRFDFKLSSNINYNKASNRNSSGNLITKLYKNENDVLTFGASSSLYFYDGKSFSTLFNFGVDQDLSKNISLSGSLNLKLYLNNRDLIAIKLASLSAPPNLTELRGSYFLRDNNSLDTFIIAGNKNLTAERINHFGLQYTANVNKLNINVELFGEKIDYPIRQETIRMMTNEAGEIFRDAVYINDSGKKTIGTNIGLQYYFDNLILFSSYIFADNSEISYYPRHSVFSKLIFNLPIHSKLQLNFNYNSKTIWKEFITDKDDDFRNDGKLDKRLFFDFAYYQNLKKLFFLRNLTLGFTIQNIFNRKIRFLPIGNFLERSIIFSFYSEV